MGGVGIEGDSFERGLINIQKVEVVLLKGRYNALAPNLDAFRNKL